ncbi:MAG: hypothetical protein WD250_07830 [Egibacteraceae bacterium]
MTDATPPSKRPEMDALHGCADYLVRQANRLVQELQVLARPPHLDRPELAPEEVDRLVQEARWLGERTARLWTQVRHHRRLRDDDAPMHEFQVTPARPRHEIAADARNTAELLSLLAVRASQVYLPAPQKLQDAITGLQQWADALYQEPSDGDG